MGPINPTPYPDINAVLRDLLAGAQAVLGERFTGLYLYGSLASGDFDPTRSDIDFVVITTGDLPAETIEALETMHARLAASGVKWAKKLEGSYIPQDAMRRYDPDGPLCPQINEGRFFVAGHGYDWVIQRHILREHGVVLAGPAPDTLIDPVQPDDLRQAVEATLAEWGRLMLNDPARLRSDEYQAYAVLTMCRALYALRHGTIVSKPVAARWARESLGERWAGLITRADAWRPGAVMGAFDETLGFVQYVVHTNQ